MKKILDRYLLKVHNKLTSYLKLDEESKEKRPCHVIYMRTNEGIHIIVTQEDPDEAIPTDGSFLGAYIYTYATVEMAREQVKKFKLDEQGFTQVT